MDSSGRFLQMLGIEDHPMLPFLKERFFSEPNPEVRQSILSLVRN